MLVSRIVRWDWYAEMNTADIYFVRIHVGARRDMGGQHNITPKRPLGKALRRGCVRDFGRILQNRFSYPTVPDRTHTDPWVPYQLPDRSIAWIALRLPAYSVVLSPTIIISKEYMRPQQQQREDSSYHWCCTLASNAASSSTTMVIMMLPWTTEFYLFALFGCNLNL